MIRDCTEAVFLADVAHHQLTVLRDDGLYRHLRFSKPGSNDMRFDVVTWPGFLAYSGDMGCFVFERLDDMLAFFRRPDDALTINERYWAEKCQAGSRPSAGDGVTEYDPDRFRERMNEWIAELRKDEEGMPDCLRNDSLDEIVRAIEEDLIPLADDGEAAVRAAVDDFKVHETTFSDFFEVDLHSYTFHFTWCCYALVWGVRLYDHQRAAAAPSPATEESHGS